VSQPLHGLVFWASFGSCLISGSDMFVAKYLAFTSVPNVYSGKIQEGVYNSLAMKQELGYFKYTYTDRCCSLTKQ